MRFCRDVNPLPGITGGARREQLLPPGKKLRALADQDHVVLVDGLGLLDRMAQELRELGALRAADARQLVAGEIDDAAGHLPPVGIDNLDRVAAPEGAPGRRRR